MSRTTNNFIMNSAGRRLPKLLLTAVFVMLAAAHLGSHPGDAQAAGDLYVNASGGADTANCGTPAQPCASIQKAVNLAASGATIRVAKGTYYYNAAADQCSSIVGKTGVVCVLNKDVTLLGGFTASNWSTPQPSTNVTIVDGQNSRRGVYVTGGTIVMDGFTIRNGYITGASSGSDAATFAFGGGMHAEASKTILRNLVFLNNVAVGGGASNTYGGAASGGGLALAAVLPGSTLDNVRFQGNQAIGGNGVTRGGFAIGGGFFTFRTTVVARNIVAVDNVARSGNSSGVGQTADGALADAQGGAIGLQIGSHVTLQNLSAYGNQAIGGTAQNGGGAFGGAIATEGLPAAGDPTTLLLQDADIRDNEAVGGNGVNGGIAGGGGIETIHTNLWINRITVVNNRALGGDGSGNQGPAGGGGLYLHNIFDGSSKATVANSIIADNLADVGAGAPVGGGGGGIWLQGLEAHLTHVTVARNRLGKSPMQGTGVLALNFGAVRATEAYISHSIIAEHTEYSNAAAIHVHAGNVVNLNRVLLSANTHNTSATGATINGLSTVIEGQARFVSPGAPHYDYHIAQDSVARNAATGSVEQSDLDADIRDGQKDLGADEYVAPQMTALSASTVSKGSVRIVWQSQGYEIESYEVMLTCPGGASSPNEMPCGARVDVGSQLDLWLTGMKSGAQYGVEVWAYTSTSAVDSMSIQFKVAEHFLYLPTVRQ